MNCAFTRTNISSFPFALAETVILILFASCLVALMLPSIKSALSITKPIFLGFEPAEEGDGQRVWKDCCVVESLWGGHTLQCDWLEIGKMEELLT